MQYFAFRSCFRLFVKYMHPTFIFENKICYFFFDILHQEYQILTRNVVFYNVLQSFKTEIYIERPIKKIIVRYHIPIRCQF